jgi:hypothetical protein
LFDLILHLIKNQNISLSLSFSNILLYKKATNIEIKISIKIGNNTHHSEKLNQANNFIIEIIVMLKLAIMKGKKNID